MTDDPPSAAPTGAWLQQVARDTRATLGGGRAILLQLAHPLIAAGVAEHSRFQTDPLGRLRETLDLMHTLIFAAPAARTAALRTFYQLHRAIQGTLPAPAGPFPSGTAYAGHDPALKLWVHATMVETQLRAYEAFVRPLSPGARAAYYRDTTILARWLGVPAALLPPTWEAFQRYMTSMLRGPNLVVTPMTRTLGQAVLHPPVGWATRATIGLGGFLSIGLLPPHLCQAYGFRWDARRQALFRSLAGLLRTLGALTPAALRDMPRMRHTPLGRWLLGDLG